MQSLSMIKKMEFLDWDSQDSLFVDTFSISPGVQCLEINVENYIYV